MKCDILCIRDDFRGGVGDVCDIVDVAFPVFAVECEVHPPIDNELDAYEQAALKMVAIGLYANSIAETLNVTQSLAKQFLANLSEKKLISQSPGLLWAITDEGKNWLNRVTEPRPSDNGEYGIMFVSAIKKDILQYFYRGDIGNISRSKVGEPGDKSSILHRKILSGKEIDTFKLVESPKAWRLEHAYLRYSRNRKLQTEHANSEMTISEARDVFADLESLGEADYDMGDDESTRTETRKSMPVGGADSRNLLVRRLTGRVPVNLFLQMRIVFSPEQPGGFTVESPFDLDGIDNDFFLRQVQWMRNNGNVALGSEKLSEYLDREAKKFCKHVPAGKKHKSVFILERLPMLDARKESFREIYDNVGDIYELSCQETNKFNRENVVRLYSVRLLEALFAKMFMTLPQDAMQKLCRKMNEDRVLFGTSDLSKRIASKAGLDCDDLFGEEIVGSALAKMARGRTGSSLKEKFINLLTVYYYLPSVSAPATKFFTLPGLKECSQIIRELDRIRNKASHYREHGSRHQEVTEDDYNYYTKNAFEVANRLLESLKENL